MSTEQNVHFSEESAYPYEIAHRRAYLENALRSALRNYPEFVFTQVQRNLNRRAFELNQALSSKEINTEKLQEVLLFVLLYDTSYKLLPENVIESRTRSIQAFIEFYLKSVRETVNTYARERLQPNRLQSILVGIASIMGVITSSGNGPQPVEAPAITLEVITQPEKEPNNTAATAQKVEWKTVTLGNSGGDNVDFFSTPLLTKNDRFIEIIVSSDQRNLPSIDVLLEDGQNIDTTYITASEENTGGVSKLKITIAEHMIGKKIVIKLDPSSETEVPYVLQVNNFSIQQEVEPNNTIDEISEQKELSSDEPLEGTLDANSVDLYKRTLSAGTFFSVTLAATEQLATGTNLQVWKSSEYKQQGGTPLSEVSGNGSNTIALKTPINEDGEYLIKVSATADQPTTTYELSHTIELNNEDPNFKIEMPSFVYGSKSNSSAAGRFTINNQNDYSLVVKQKNASEGVTVTGHLTQTVPFTLPMSSQPVQETTVEIVITAPTGKELIKVYPVTVIDKEAAQTNKVQVVVRGYDYQQSEGINKALDNFTSEIKRKFPSTVVIEANTQEKLFAQLDEVIPQAADGFVIWYVGHGLGGTMLIDLRQGMNGAVTPAEWVHYLEEKEETLHVSAPALFLLMCEVNAGAFESTTSQGEAKSPTGVVMGTSDAYTNTYVELITNEDGSKQWQILGAEALIEGYVGQQKVTDVLKNIQKAIAQVGRGSAQNPSADTEVGENQSVSDTAVVGGAKEKHYYVLLPVLARN